MATRGIPRWGTPAAVEQTPPRERARSADATEAARPHQMHIPTPERQRWLLAQEEHRMRLNKDEHRMRLERLPQPLSSVAQARRGAGAKWAVAAAITASVVLVMASIAWAL